MPQSEKIGELAKAIAAAQAELKPVKRESENPFFKSRYADLASVWEAVKPFQKHGIAITQMPFDAGEGMIGITTQLTHESGEWINGSLALPVSKADAQGVGSAITYARRYAIGCLTGVVTEDDDDGNQAVQAKQAQQRFAQQRATIAKAFQEIRQDIKTVVEQDGANAGAREMDAPRVITQQASDAAPPFNPEVCPPPYDGVMDEDYQAFLEYVGDDPDRTKIGKKMKAKMGISEMGAVPPAKRKAIMLSIQDEAKRQGVPFSVWVHE